MKCLTTDGDDDKEVRGQNQSSKNTFRVNICSNGRWQTTIWHVVVHVWVGNLLQHVNERIFHERKRRQIVEWTQFIFLHPVCEEKKDETIKSYDMTVFCAPFFFPLYLAHHLTWSLPWNSIALPFFSFPCHEFTIHVPKSKHSTHKIFLSFKILSPISAVLYRCPKWRNEWSK